MEKNPFRIYCKNCGAPIGFDIVRQSYRCRSCGSQSGIEEERRIVHCWREWKRQETREMGEMDALLECACSSCGARLLLPAGEEPENCDFCGSRLVRGEFREKERLPELIIPFLLTEDEARERMRRWARERRGRAEGRAVLSHMDSFRGYYLPCCLMRGPVSAGVSRCGKHRSYFCRGYLDGSAVNASRQLDKLPLNEIEPFDWTAAEGFSYGFIAGQRVKLCDLSGRELNARISEEAAEEFRPEVERVMQTGGVSLSVNTGEMTILSALLPIYFIRAGSFSAVMNGQSGRISVTRERGKERSHWTAEAAVYTLLASFLLGYLFRFDLSGLLLFGLLFGCLFFSLMGATDFSLLQRIADRAEKRGERRERGSLENPFDNTPVFYERSGRGELIPVRPCFYNPIRLLEIFFKAAALIFLPLLLALSLRILRDGMQLQSISSLHPGRGLIWYLLSFFLCIFYFTKGVREDAYEHPILYELLPSGRKRLIGSRSSRSLSPLAVFSEAGDGGEIGGRGLIPAFRAMGGAGIPAALLLFLLLLGSTAAIMIPAL